MTITAEEYTSRTGLVPVKRHRRGRVMAHGWRFIPRHDGGIDLGSACGLFTNDEIEPDLLVAETLPECGRCARIMGRQ